MKEIHRSRLTAAGLITAVFSVAVFPSAVSSNHKGNKSYKQKKYDEAARHYREAEIEAPEEKAVPYNLGNALYKAGDFNGAVQSLEKAKKTGDPELKKHALFNLGNSHYRAGSNARDPGAGDHLKAALESYKDALKLDPSDQNAKFNLQKTLQMMEQQKQQQQQSQNDKDKNGKDDKDQKGQNSKGDQGDSTRQNQNQEQAENKPGQGEKEGEQKEGEQKDKQDQGDSTRQAQAPRPKPGEMSEAEARALLESLQKDEGEWQKKRLKKLSGPAKLEKDW